MEIRSRSGEAVATISPAVTIVARLVECDRSFGKQVGQERHLLANERQRGRVAQPTLQFARAQQKAIDLVRLEARMRDRATPPEALPQAQSPARFFANREKCKTLTWKSRILSHEEGLGLRCAKLQAAFFVPLEPRGERETSPSLSMKYKYWLSRVTAFATTTSVSPSPDLGFRLTLPSPSMKYKYAL